ncbi:MAG: hypothetical protein EON91_08145 [Brevundimonas sp.]|uniref:biliverdin-producing heme oxygenase n=1 Tax=Brevundimonas sp. TaxID=1871086 RepID=UPI00122823EA|nr:biliverdin-producing heme oxygenase [Brevundimonas sp.]RZJ17719.1 MAG: hypothetical protein EON91_08145 [Brevundimonas sp.]
MTDNSVLENLRQATHAAHQALEDQADVEARLRDPARRAVMVAALLDLHAGAEAALAQWSNGIAALGVPVADRSAALRIDVQALGGAGATPTPATVPDLGQALGWTYVIEGSALGGRVMLKRMKADGVNLTGLGHLDIHGDQTGARWRNVLGALEAADRAGVARASMVRGACDAFAFAHRILAPAPSEIAA